jgi:hypothetical protein
VEGEAGGHSLAARLGLHRSRNFDSRAVHAAADQRLAHSLGALARQRRRGIAFEVGLLGKHIEQPAAVARPARLERGKIDRLPAAREEEALGGVHDLRIARIDAARRAAAGGRAIARALRELAQQLGPRQRLAVGLRIVAALDRELQARPIAEGLGERGDRFFLGRR